MRPTARGEEGEGKEAPRAPVLGTGRVGFPQEVPRQGLHRGETPRLPSCYWGPSGPLGPVRVPKARRPSSLHPWLAEAPGAPVSWEAPPWKT